MNPAKMNQKISNPSTHSHEQPNALNRTVTLNQTPDPLDRILLTEAPLLPTSGFALSVMDSIRDEASQSESKFSSTISFPWTRILPGAILALSLLAWLIWKSAAAAFSELSTESFQLALPTHLQLTAPMNAVLWLLVALAASLLPMLLIRRIMGRSALL
jgi:hypothetical protein